MVLCHSKAQNGQYGVGFYVHKKFSKNIEEFVPVNERIATITLIINQQKIRFIQAHAPTSTASEEEIENFYGTLEETLLNSKIKDQLILADLNAKIGKQESYESKAMGKFNYGKRNKRGQMLVDFAIQHELKITNTFFKKSKERMWTWRSPSGHKNQIDFILARDMRQITDVDVINNFIFDSDHRLVRAVFKTNKKQLRAQRFKKGFKKELLNANKLEYSEVLNEKLETAMAIFENSDVQSIYNHLEKIISDTAAEITASVKEKNDIHNNFTYEIQHLINQRLKLERIKDKTLTQKIELTEIRKLIKKKTREEQRKKDDEMALEIMETSGSTKQIAKKLSIGQPWMLTLKDNKDNQQFIRTSVLEIATEFYEELYSDENLEIQYFKRCNNKADIPPFLTDEIKNAIIKLQNNKSPGEDNIINELLKYGVNELVAPLQYLYNKILISEEIPWQWKKSQIILIYKKGDKSNISNYRPISLLPSLYKLFTKLIENRISGKLNEFQSDEQAGFRKHRSTIDHLHVINQLIEKSTEYNTQLYIAFVDYSKAFDSLKHPSIWQALEQTGLEMNYVNIIKNIYKDNTATIKLEKEGRPFPIKKGVRQGDPLSSTLFNCVLENVFKNLNWEEKRKGININGKKLTHLCFADDIVVFAYSPEELQTLLADLNEESKKVGLIMNSDKTKILTNSTKSNITLKNNKIEHVDEYIYLGQIVSFKNRLQKEINRRTTSAWSKYWSLKRIFKSNMPMYIKRRTFDMCVSPVLTYGCQTWALTAKQVRQIQVCQNKMERSMLGVSWKEKMRKIDVKKRTKIADVTTTIRNIKWKWAGHVARMHPERWTYGVTFWLPINKKRSRGRQPKRWVDDIRKAAGATWSRLAADRKEWQLLGEAYA